MGFAQKLMSVSIQLASGGAGNGQFNLSGLRMSATIDVVGGISSGMMELAIYGLSLADMNALTVVSTQINAQRNNKIQLSAGDSDAGMTMVFSGNIFTAFMDGLNQPQVPFRISAVPGGGYWAMKPVAPVSQKGPQDVATLLGPIAGSMGLSLENNGVNVKLTNPYYPGAPWTQAINIARHANIEMVAERGKLAISPAGQPRTSGSTPTISSATGMVGYPAFRQASLIVKSLFNPAVQCNGTITVQSDITAANGTWMVIHIVYELESFMPHGRWFQTMFCTLAKGDQSPA